MAAGSTLQLSDLDGIWQSRGYGWLVEFKNGKPSAYDVTPNLCVPHTTQSSELKNLGRTIALSDDGKTAHFTLDETNYDYIFDRVKAPPPERNMPSDTGPVAVFDALVEFFDTHYAFFLLRNIDWQNLVKAYRRNVHDGMSDKELYDLCKRLLSHTGDSHVTLCGRVEGKHREFEAKLPTSQRKARPSFQSPDISPDAGCWIRGIGEALTDQKVKTGARKSIRHGVIDGDIGYLSVRSMDSGGRKSVVRAMDRAIEMFEGCRAVIIDVSMNGGGLDPIARLIASHFVSNKTVAYYKYAADTKGAELQPMTIEPCTGRRYTGPVYVTTSYKTASAAEIFVLMLRALPNVIHVGDASEGILSDMLEKQLPNGWELTLSNEVYLDSDKKHWECDGIAPEISFKVWGGNKSKEKHQNAARALLEILLSRAAV